MRGFRSKRSKTAHRLVGLLASVHDQLARGWGLLIQEIGPRLGKGIIEGTVRLERGTLLLFTWIVRNLLSACALLGSGDPLAGARGSTLRSGGEARGLMMVRYAPRWSCR